MSNRTCKSILKICLFIAMRKQNKENGASNNNGLLTLRLKRQKKEAKSTDSNIAK